MIANGDIGNHVEDGVSGASVPSGLIAYASSHQDLVARLDHQYSYARWYADSHQVADFDAKSFVSYAAQNGSPIVYLPQATGIVAARVAHAMIPLDLPFSWSTAQYGARLGNLVMFLLVGAASISYVRRYRHLVFASATLPVTVQLAASAGYDALLIATCLSFFALVIGLLERGRGPKKIEIVLLLVMAFMLGHLKSVYAPLLIAGVLLFRVMPVRDCLVLLAGMAAVSFAGAITTVAVFGLAHDPAREVLYRAQVDWLLTHLADIPRLIASSLYQQRGFLTIGFLANFGSIDTNWTLPALILPVIGLILAWVTSMTKGPGMITWRGGAVLYSGLGLCLAAMYVATYVVWTSHAQADGIGAEFVNGVQGRYFLPLFLFAIAPFAAGPAWLSAKSGKLAADLTLAQICVVGLSLTLMLFAVVQRFWVPAYF